MIRTSPLLLSVALSAFVPLATGDARSDWTTFEATVSRFPAITAQLDYRQARFSGNQAYSGGTGSLDAPVIQLNIPLGHRGEAVIAYPVWRSLRGPDINVGNGGDPSFHTKLLLTRPDRPAGHVAFLWGVLEPAANPPIGPDNLAFFARVAGTVSFGPERRWQLDANLGTAIHESDNRRRQDDVITLSTALWYDANPIWHAGVEVVREDQTTGRWFDLTETTDSAYKRRSIAATLTSGDAQQLFFTIRRGLTAQSGGWSLTTGVEWQLR